MNSTEVTAPVRVTVQGFVAAQQLAYARSKVDVDGERFDFLKDHIDGRGRVLYRRYDGHHGLIMAAGD